jgi:hypothetical protein
MHGACCGCFAGAIHSLFESSATHLAPPATLLRTCPRLAVLQVIDAFMHANAFIPEVGMVMVYNPTGAY